MSSSAQIETNPTANQKKKAFLCSFNGFLLRHSFFLILRPIIAGFHSPNKKVIAKLLTIPLNLLQVSAHILACLLLHGSTTTNMPKEWKMSLMEIRETWIKMTSKEERGRTFGVAAFALGIGGVLISYLPLPFFCFPASVACGVNAYKCGQRRWGGAVIVMGVIGILGFLFIMVSAFPG